MDCAHYIQNLLSAHVDGELRGREERLADDHVSSCISCQQRLAQEREVKRLLRSQSRLARVPADLRLHIRAALGELVETELRARRPARQRYAAAVARWGACVRRYPLRFAVPLAAVAMLMVLGVKSLDFKPLPQVSNAPLFSLAVNKFDASLRDFAPNATAEDPDHGDSDFAWVMDRDSSADNSTDEADDLARAYRDAGIPEEIYDFRAVGYGLYGGRIDQAPDGYPVAYTLYSGERGEILSICLHAANFAAPLGALYWAGTHTFYEYQGHSICLTFHPAGHFVSILVSQEPVTALLRDVTQADSASAEF